MLAILRRGGGGGGGGQDVSGRVGGTPVGASHFEAWGGGGGEVGQQ